jgi:predicted MFS family arabinose efflux permease
LQGFAFALLLVVVGLPIGRLVDTGRRITIVALGTALWSLMTALSGLTHGFWQLLLCRMGVGMGEACLTPAALSLLADWFPPRRHGLAFGIYGTGTFVGSGLSYWVAGDVIRHLGTGVDPALPLVGTVHPWQAVFLAAGLPGIVFAALVATLKEPLRRNPGGATVATALVRDVVRYFRTHWRPILLVDLCTAFAAMTAYSLTAWTPSLFVRTYGWSVPDIGRRFGVVVVITGIVGFLSTGAAGDVLVARGDVMGRLRVIVGCALLAAPLVVLAPLQADPWAALGCYASANLLITAAAGAGPAAQLALVPGEMRGMMLGLAFLIVNLLGMGLGPTAVALVTDYVLGDAAKIRYALAGAPAVMLLLCAWTAMAATKSYGPCARSAGN